MKVDSVRALAARLLGLEAALGQFIYKQLNMVTLNFDDTFFECATSATTALERTGQLLEFGLCKRYAGHGGNRFAAPAFAFPADTGNAITLRNGRLFADTGVARLAAIRAVPTRIG